MSDLPVGHNAYLKRWWREGRQRGDKQAFTDPTGTLAVAEGPLLAEELPQISPNDALTGTSIDEVLDQAVRYVSGDRERGYHLTHKRIFEFLRRR